jgi:hypothetical protein
VDENVGSIARRIEQDYQLPPRLGSSCVAKPSQGSR